MSREYIQVKGESKWVGGVGGDPDPLLRGRCPGEWQEKHPPPPLLLQGKSKQINVVVF